MQNQKTILTLGMLVKFSTEDILKYFSLFFQKKKVLALHANCLSETICMKCHSLFSGKNKKKYHQFAVFCICTESGKGEFTHLTTNHNHNLKQCSLSSNYMYYITHVHHIFFFFFLFFHSTDVIIVRQGIANSGSVMYRSCLVTKSPWLAD